MKLMTVLALATILGACSGGTNTSNQASGKGMSRSPDNDSGSNSRPQKGTWTVSEETDPMTDETVRTARASLTSGRYEIQAQISCSTGGALHYRFTSFSGDEPERFSLYQGLPYVEVRRDRGRAYRYLSDENRHNNVLMISTNADRLNLERLLLRAEAGGEGDDGGFVLHRQALRLFHDAINFGRAGTLTLRLPLASGDATLRIDQNASAIRSVIQPCVEISDRASRYVDAAMQDRRAQTQTSEAPTEDALSPTVTTEESGEVPGL